jgi:hypothetical protein
VVALLPADTALACAQALRSAFTGCEVKTLNGDVLFQSPAPGFLSSDKWKDDHGRGRPIPFLVPGPAADASVGIAIAHFKSPLQDVVRAAQAAEKRAKKQLDRSAVAVTLFKRSGETIEWGCKWDSGGLELFQAIRRRLGDGHLSAKFPHRVAELLEPYLLKKSEFLSMQGAIGFDYSAVIGQEFQHALSRQTQLSGADHQTMSEDLSAKLDSYLKKLSDDGDHRIQALIGLCQTVAFAHRTRDENSNPE